MADFSPPPVHTVSPTRKLQEDAPALPCNLNTAAPTSSHRNRRSRSPSKKSISEDTATAQMSQKMELRRLKAVAEVDEANKGLAQRIDDIFGEPTPIQQLRENQVAAKGRQVTDLRRPLSRTSASSTPQQQVLEVSKSTMAFRDRLVLHSNTTVAHLNNRPMPPTTVMPTPSPVMMSQSVEHLPSKRSISLTTPLPLVVAPTPDALRSPQPPLRSTSSRGASRLVPGSPRLPDAVMPSSSSRPVSRAVSRTQAKSRVAATSARLAAGSSDLTSSSHPMLTSITMVPRAQWDADPTAALPVSFEESKFHSLIAWAEMSFEEAVTAARGAHSAPSTVPTAQLQSRPSRVLTAACCSIVDEIMRHLPFRSTSIWDTMKQEIFGAIFHREWTKEDSEQQQQQHQSTVNGVEEQADTKAKMDTWFSRVMAPRPFWFDERDDIQSKLEEAERQLAVFAQYDTKYEHIFEMQQRQFDHDTVKRFFGAWRSHTGDMNRRRSRFMRFIDSRHAQMNYKDAFERWRQYTTAAKFRAIRNQISSDNATKEAMLRTKQQELQFLQRNLEDEREKLKASVEREAKRNHGIVATHQIEVREMQAMQVAKDNIIVHLEKIAKRWERIAKTYRPAAGRHVAPSRSLRNAAKVALESEEQLIVRGTSAPRLTKAKEDLEALLLVWVNDILRKLHCSHPRHSTAARQSFVSALTSVTEHGSPLLPPSSRQSISPPPPPVDEEFKPLTNLTIALRDGEVLMQVAKYLVRKSIPDAYSDAEGSLFSVVTRALYLGTSQGMSPPLMAHCGFHHRFFTADTFLESPHPTGILWILASLFVSDVTDSANTLAASAPALTTAATRRAPFLSNGECLLQTSGLSSIGLMLASRFDLEGMPRPKSLVRLLQQKMQEQEEKAHQQQQQVDTAALRPTLSGNPFCTIFMEDTESDLDAFFDDEEDADDASQFHGGDGVDVMSAPSDEEPSRAVSPEQLMVYDATAPVPGTGGNHHSGAMVVPPSLLPQVQRAFATATPISGQRRVSVGTDSQGGGGTRTVSPFNGLPPVPVVVPVTGTGGGGVAPQTTRRRLSAVRVIEEDNITHSVPTSPTLATPAMSTTAGGGPSFGILVPNNREGLSIETMHAHTGTERRSSMTSEMSLTPSVNWSRTMQGGHPPQPLHLQREDSVRGSTDRSSTTSAALQQDAFGVPSPLSTNERTHHHHRKKEGSDRRLPSVREDLRQVPMSRLLRLLRGEDRNRTLWYSLGRLVTSLVVRFRVLDVDIPIKSARSGTIVVDSETFSPVASSASASAPAGGDRRRSVATSRRASVATSKASSSGSSSTPRGPVGSSDSEVRIPSVGFHREASFTMAAKTPEESTDTSQPTRRELSVKFQ